MTAPVNHKNLPARAADDFPASVFERDFAAIEALLAEAKTQAEVIDAMKRAKTLDAYAKIHELGNAVRWELLKLQMKAMIRIAEEVEKARREEELATHGGDRSKARKPGLEIIGISSQRLSEWRRLATYGVNELAILAAELSEKGFAPSLNRILAAIDAEDTTDAEEDEKKPAPKATTPDEDVCPTCGRPFD